MLVASTTLAYLVTLCIYHLGFFRHPKVVLFASLVATMGATAFGVVNMKRRGLEKPVATALRSLPPMPRGWPCCGRALGFNGWAL